MHKPMMFLVAIVGVVLLATNAAIAATVVEDDFPGTTLDTGKWTVISGAPVVANSYLSLAGGDNVRNNVPFQYGTVTIKIRNFYDSRASGDYSRYTMGYWGLMLPDQTRFILLRNDTQAWLRLDVYYGYLQHAYPLDYYTNDGQTHDLDCVFTWDENGINVDIDDLNNGPGVDANGYWATGAGSELDAPMMVFLTGNTMLNGTLDFDYIKVFQPEPTCGGWGYWSADLNQDCYVNWEDFSVFASQWLYCSEASDPNCTQP